MNRLIPALLVCALLTPAAVADDINPPPWRGLPGTTVQGWEFATPDPNPVPDIIDNPLGPPGILVEPGFDQQWQDLYEGRQGVWPLSGTIEIDIPNYDQLNPEKIIWIQLTWLPQVVGDYALEVRGKADVDVDWTPAAVVIDDVTPDGWNHTTFEIVLEPNPAFESVFIGGTVMVDELVIDTWCVPEPATLSLLALGGLALIRRR